MRKLMLVVSMFVSLGVLGGEKPVKDTTINGCTYTIFKNRKGQRYIYVRKQNQPLVTYKAYLLDSGRVRIVFYRGYQSFL